MVRRLQTPVPKPQPLIVVEVPAETKGFSIGTWTGLPNYICSSCPFSTLDLNEMLLHQKFNHGR